MVCVSGFPLLCLNIRMPCDGLPHRQELVGLPKFSHASLPACHGLSTPADLPTLAILQTGVLVLPSVGVEPLGVRYLKFRSCTSTSGRAGTPTAYRILCLRFAQLVRSLFLTLLSLLRTGRKTRYGWLARPYPAGTFTLQETPSFLGAIDGRDAGYPAPPVRTRTCSFPAFGSSDVLASALLDESPQASAFR